MGTLLTLFFVLIGAAERVLGGLARRLTLLLPNRAGARVGARHCGQAEAVSGCGGAHRADGRLALVGCWGRLGPNLTSYK